MGSKVPGAVVTDPPTAKLPCSWIISGSGPALVDLLCARRSEQTDCNQRERNERLPVAPIPGIRPGDPGGREFTIALSRFLRVGPLGLPYAPLRHEARRPPWAKECFPGTALGRLGPGVQRRCCRAFLTARLSKSLLTAAILLDCRARRLPMILNPAAIPAATSRIQ